MQVQELSCPHLAGLADTQFCKAVHGALLGNLQRPLSLARAGSVVDLHPVVNNGFACCALPKANPLPQNLQLWPVGRQKGSRSAEASGKNTHGIVVSNPASFYIKWGPAPASPPLVCSKPAGQGQAQSFAE